MGFFGLCPKKCAHFLKVAAVGLRGIETLIIPLNFLDTAGGYAIIVLLSDNKEEG
jgi:hypothetical protein